MGIYDKQIANAARQIKAKGASVTWRQIALVAEDTTKPWKATATPTDYPVSILFLPSTNLKSLSSKGKGGTEYIKEGDVQNVSERGLMGAVPFTPKLKDLVIKPDGTTLQISSFETLRPDGNAILYLLEFSE